MGLVLAVPLSCPQCGSPALQHGSPDLPWCPTLWSALQREQAVEGDLKGKALHLHLGSGEASHLPGSLCMRQWHLACSECPSTSTVGTSIPQQIPSLPCDSSTLRLVPYHPSSPF